MQPLCYLPYQRDTKYVLLHFISEKLSQEEHRMSQPPLWPAHLHHFCLRTTQLESQAEWYRKQLEMDAEKLAEGSVWLTSSQRNLILSGNCGTNGDRIERGRLRFAAYALGTPEQVPYFDAWIKKRGVERSEKKSPIFANDQISIEDPDGNTFVFGVPNKKETKTPDRLPGRLQHIGICTPDIDRLKEFYIDVIGFRLSDVVSNDKGTISACFLRSDHEHHDLALFKASSSRFDHQCYETTCWNDIRDWGDHFSKTQTRVEWGAARHGAGNNLFIFVRDLDGNPVEMSAELETRRYDDKPGIWKTEERTLSLWCSAWSRD